MEVAVDDIDVNTKEEHETQSPIKGESGVMVGKAAIHPDIGSAEAGRVKGMDDKYVESEVQRLEARGFSMERGESEESKWNVLQNIRNMPTNLAVKRCIKRKMLSGTTTKMSAFQIWKWNNRVRWANTKRAYREIAVYLELWGRPMKRIEGRHGTGVLSYFLFLKWLLFLNVVMFIMIFVFLSLPQSFFSVTDYSVSVTGLTNTTTIKDKAKQCSAKYTVDVSSDPGQLILDLLQGTGWMEKTVMFYGAYADTELNVTDTTFNYNLPLAYITVVCVCFLVCLVIMARTMGRTFRQSIANSDVNKTKWTTSVLCGWDYSIYVASAAVVKQKSIYHEIFIELNEEREEILRLNRTGKQKCVLYSVRIVINLIILAFLGAGAYLIYWVTMFSTGVLKNEQSKKSYNSRELLVIEYLPSITISALTGIFPALFQKLVILEKYRPVFEINLTLVRTVFLKLASLSMLVITLYSQIVCETKDWCDVGTGSCNPLTCWETYVGQQFYKLVIMDFLVTLIMVLVVEVLRKVIVTHSQCRLTKLIGYHDFDITKNVLDLVYSQTLCWVGFFFAPLITPMCVAKLVILFYLKLLSSLFLCVPTDRPYKASKTNNFFIAILLIAFFLACIPIGWTISELSPSRGCGPFRVHDRMYGIFDVTKNNWSESGRAVWTIVTSPAVIVAVLVLLCLVIYYFSVLHKANRDMVGLLRLQLVIEAKDKQFLLRQLGRDRPPPTRKLRNIPPAAKLYGSTPNTPTKTMTPVIPTPNAVATPPPPLPNTPDPPLHRTPDPPQYDDTPRNRGLNDF